MNAPVDRRLPAQRAKVALASLQLATAMAAVTVAKSIEPKPLYVRRDLTNAADLVAWAKKAGIPNIVAPSEMHVTVCYSRAPVDWLAMGQDYRDVVTVSKGGPRVLARFGKTDAKVLVLAFASSDLEWRHSEMREKGASFDFPSYRPHVTIGLNLPADFDLDAVEPYRGALRFGPEVFEAIDDNFTVRMAKAGWATQARVPSGPKGGQWTASGGAGGTVTPQKLVTPWLGQNDVAAHRFKADAAQAAFMKPMKESEFTGKPAWLGNDEGIVLKNPQKPTSPENNENPDDRATFVAGHSPGEGLNGIPFKPWDGPPGGDWSKVDGTGSFDEPDLPATKGKRLGAGVVITEDDGRVWTLTPTNHFGGYFETLPKGGIEEGLNLRQTAIKEAWEESGLKVELTGYIGDFERNTSVARYYSAKRVGGDPTDYHWETAASHLVPMADLDDALHHVNDKPILARLKGESDTVIKLALGFADLVELLGEVVEKGKAWSSQPRVPAGFPTGGRWMKGGYGGGGWGGMFAENATALTLQKHGGTGPQSEALNAKIKMFEDAANQGYIHPAAQKLILKPKPTQTYSAAAWESANEAATYVHAMKGMGKKFHGGAAPDATPAAKPKDAPKAAPSANLYTAPVGTFKDPMKLSDMTKAGAKPGGSAAGALYKDASGDLWMVKSYDSSTMAFNEVASAKLYEQMGVAVPEMKLIDLEGAHKGGIGVASKMMDLKPFDVNNPAHVKAAQADFAAHALMANWDAVGLSFDNLMIDAATGKTVMVDPGGSMLYRAQGGLKGKDFKDNVTELDSMRDPMVNPTAAKVFGKMTQEQIVDSMQKAIAGLGDASGDGILGLKQEVASAIVNHWGGSNKITETVNLMEKMDNRLSDMQAKAKAMTADFASTAALDITTTGTTKAVFSHPDPNVQMLANIHDAKTLDTVIQAQTVNAMNFEALMTGSSAAFYSQQLAKASKAAFAGDTMKVAETFYIPTSSKAKLSENYALYKKSYNAIVSVGEAQAALKLQDAAKAGDGGMVTGASKVTPADVTVSLKEAGMTAPGTNMLHPDWVKDGDPTNLGAQIESANLAEAAATSIPKAPAQPVLAVPTAMPVMPKLSSPANPNLKLNAIANEIAKLATSGDPDAAVKVQALSAMIKGSNSFSVKAKTYAANVVAALGGQAVIDAIPAAPKKKAQDAAIEAGSAVLKDLGGIQIKETKVVAQFDPAAIPEPPDFMNWNGPGKGLSSKPGVNEANQQIVTTMQGLAKGNDLPGLVKVDPGPSQHTQIYKGNLTQMLQDVGKVSIKTEIVSMGGVSKASAAAIAKSVGQALKPKPSWSPEAKKFGKHVIAGAIPAVAAQALFDNIPAQKHGASSSVIGKLADDVAKFTTLEEQQALANHVGHGYNWSGDVSALLNSKPGQADYDKAIKNAKMAEQGINKLPDLPVGLVVTRGVSNGSFSEWKALEGSVINQPSLTSTSVNYGKWGGPVYLKMKMGEGVKGAYVGDASQATLKTAYNKAHKGKQNIGLSGTEQELILPRNTKWMVARVKKADGTDDVIKNKSGTIVEIVVLPHDEAEISA